MYTFSITRREVVCGSYLLVGPGNSTVDDLLRILRGSIPVECKTVVVMLERCVACTFALSCGHEYGSLISAEEAKHFYHFQQDGLSQISIIVFIVTSGSVYGPVGYTMLVNSVVNVVHKCKVFMYADDMCLLYASHNILEARSEIQNDFDNIVKWAHDNGIIININKTQCLRIFSPYNRLAKTVSNSQIGIIGHTYECLHKNQVACDCENLEFVTRFKYLGLLIDQNFNFKLHIDGLCNKLRSILGKFYQLRTVVSKKTLRIVYYALADSLVTYGLVKQRKLKQVTENVGEDLKLGLSFRSMVHCNKIPILHMHRRYLREQTLFCTFFNFIPQPS
ncbi:reverse transcriptase (RNA-dependent DNA polymerase) domain-containing protein [Phthorimaea operculella]|nr:reverse transcriptase (RNA-dependent DNA polymerase) domain-containing protein [Phthorimaea operculella]